jgi:acylphosphatase
MSDIKRLHVLFDGHVQGVGFRFSVEHFARAHKVSGFVRNCVDGKVELVAEGEKSELEDFLREICNGPLKSYIYDHLDSWQEAQGTYRRFRIAY